MNKVYIQTLNGYFPDDWIHSAWLGFNKLGFQIITFEDINEVPLNKNNIVVSWVEDTLKYLKDLGIDIPKALNIPKELEGFCQRRISYSNIADFKKLIKEEKIKTPCFIKPIKLKSFPSGVISNKEIIDLTLSDVKGEEEILISSIITMNSEWRGFVHKNELVGLQWYAGDFSIFPNVSTIKDAIKKYKSQPIAYTIDFAVNDNNQTLLIECNDAFSIGSYGLESKTYAKMIRDRWYEIMKSNN